MARFSDQKGGTWEFDLTVGHVELLKEEADFDCDALADDPEGVAKILFQNRRAIPRILWVLCQGQAKDRGVTDRDFGFLLDTDTLDRGADAFAEAFLRFYHRSSAGRAIGARFPEFLRKVDQEVEARVGEHLDRALSPTATASPGSAASTPAG